MIVSIIIAILIVIGFVQYQQQRPSKYAREKARAFENAHPEYGTYKELGENFRNAKKQYDAAKIRIDIPEEEKQRLKTMVNNEEKSFRRNSEILSNKYREFINKSDYKKNPYT